MSTTTNQEGRRKALDRREAVLNSLITRDNHEVLFTANSMTITANIISKITNKKMTQDQISELFEYVKLIPPERYFSQTLRSALQSIAESFLQRKRPNNNLLSPEGNIDSMLGIDKITDGPGHMQEYQKMELNQLTSNENQLKYTYYPDKRGNAVVDRPRVLGDYSSPDSIPPYSVTHPAAQGPSGIQGVGASNTASAEMVNLMKTLSSFLNPQSITEVFTGMRQVWTTYETVSLPHQTLPFDTRNRLLTSGNNYSWYINYSGFAGQQGNIQIQDNLQEIVRMRISPFWLPVNSALVNYYGKIRLLIEEFKSQSILGTEFPYNDPGAPFTYNYHFEFNATRRSKNMLYLEPVYSTFTFRTALARVEKITTRFLAPFNTINFDNDRLLMTVSSAVVAIVSSPIPHNLATGDLVYFTNYDSVSTALNNTVNSADGYFITKLSPTTFSVPIDTTAAGVPIECNVYFASKRIIMQIEFTSLES